MRPSQMLGVGVLYLLGAVRLDAQQPIPYNQRTRFAAPPIALDSNTIQLRIVDAKSGLAVRALICFSNGVGVATDSAGEARITHLPQTNTWVGVVAAGYQPTTLIFFPGKRGRSFATVRLENGGPSEQKPGCASTPWPA